MITTINEFRILENRFNTFEYELKNILKSPQFVKFLLALGYQLNVIKNLTLSNLIFGFCREVAAYMFLKYGANIFYIQMQGEGHAFVKYNNKYYDGYNYLGVNDVSELKWCEDYIKKDSIKYKEMLNNRINTWKSFPRRYTNAYKKSLQ